MVVPEVALKSFSCTINVSPRGKGRPRFGNGRTFTDEKTVNAEAEIRWLVRKEAPPCLEGPLELTAVFYLKRPKSAPKKRVYPAGKPDLDNLLKLLSDALNDLCWVDDAQIVTAVIMKRYTDNLQDRERIVFTVQEIA